MKQAVYNDLYNEDIKTRFLSERYSEVTAKGYRQIFGKTFSTESFLKKDLYDFSYSEIKEVLDGLGAKSTASLSKSKTIIKKYIDWAIYEGYRTSAIDMIDLFSKKDLKKSVNRVNKFIRNREELYQICDQIYNPQDACLIALLYEGVRGRTENESTFEELKNLKVEDVNVAKNMLRLTKNDRTNRPLVVHEKTMQIIKNAIDEEFYYQDNGNSVAPTAKRVLNKTQHVLRTVQREDSGEQISTQAINSKFKKIKIWADRPYLNPTVVYQSGQIDRLNALKNELGELTHTEFKKICQEWGLKEENFFNLQDMYGDYE